MANTDRTPTTREQSRVRSRSLSATVVSLVVLTGCVTAFDEMDPQGAPADRAVTRTSVTQAPGSPDQRAEGYLEPFADVGDGAVRKIGSRYFQRCGGHWVETAHEDVDVGH